MLFYRHQMDIRTFLAKGKGPKFYGVQAGHKPGVYETWEEAEEQIKGFPKARHRSFATKEEAEEFIAQPSDEIYQPPETKPADSQLNTQQRAAFDAVVDGKSIFITGPGGTGKSFLLENLHDHFKLRSKRKLAITAMTGCAAVLIGPFAKTLHSWAGIGLGRGDPEKIAETVATDKRKGPRWRKTDCLVIDEVSMMTPGLLDLLDVVGRRARKCPDRPFGGIQMVFVGDFYQLPPVSREGPGGFAFDSPLWSRVVKETFFLTEIVRQKDPIFQQILNEARIGELSTESYEILESRKTMDWKRKEIKPTLLFTKNNDVNEINEGQMKKLPGEEHVFVAETYAPPGMARDVVQMLVEKLDKDAPYEVELRLKERAQVMLLKQLYEETDEGKPGSAIHGLVNGSRGIVTGFSAAGDPIVKFLNGKTITVKRATWSSDDEPEALTREQIPLRVAYALTIHKAQGASLDSALVDVGPSTFECGQAYVALSRVRSLEALYIFEISKRAFRANTAVKAFYSNLASKIEDS
jgi:ATP-dependent DNA helicase PIF1